MSGERANDGDAGAPLLIRVEIAVRWRDLDAFNHVNNSSYLTFLEEARLCWFQALPGAWIDDDVAPLLAAAHINYRRSIEWPAQVAVELWCERIGNSSLAMGHRIVAAHDASVVHADGNTVLVWADRRTGRGGALPAVVREAAGRGLPSGGLPSGGLPTGGLPTPDLPGSGLRRDAADD